MKRASAAGRGENMKMEIEQGWGGRWEMAEGEEEELPTFCISPARQNLIKTEKRKLWEGRATWGGCDMAQFLE